MKRIVPYLSVVVIITAFILLFIPIPPFGTVPTVTITNYFPRYVFQSEKRVNYDQYPIYFPPVTVTPGTLKYRLLPLYEEYQMFVQQEEPLFFASKRINEILTWKDLLRVDGLSEVSDAVSWEDLLSRYQILINKQIVLIDHTIDGTTKMQSENDLKRSIVQHNQKLEDLLKTNNYSQNKKEYLQKYITDIYNGYAKRLSIEPGATPAGTSYSLHAIQAGDDFGVYDMYIDEGDIPFNGDRLVLSVDKKQYHPTYQPITSGHGFFDFGTVPITGKTQEVLLSDIKTEYPLQFTEATASARSLFFFSDITHFIPTGESSLKAVLSMPANVAIISMSGPVSSASAIGNLFSSKDVEHLKKEENEFLVQKNGTDVDKRYILIAEVPYSHPPLSGSLAVTFQSLPELQVEKRYQIDSPIINYHVSGHTTIVQLWNISAGQVGRFIAASNPVYKVTTNKKKSAGSYEVTFEPKYNLQLFSGMLFIIGIFGLIVFRWKGISRLTAMPHIHFNVPLKHIYYPRLFIVISLIYLFFEVFLLKRSIDILELLCVFSLLYASFSKQWSTLLYYFAGGTFLLSIVLFILQKDSFRIASDWTFLLFIFFILQLIFKERSRD